MTDTPVTRETPDLHDLWGGIATAPAADTRALPTPSTPGYTYFTDYLGHRWTCCVCMNQYLIYLQKRWIQLGWIHSGIDIWQLTGGAVDSAGTHSQGGVGDIIYETDDKYVLYLRDHGATAAWRRTLAQGFAKVHIHFVLRGCPHNSPAAYQVTEEQYGPPSGVSAAGYHGGDGLVGTAFDYHRDPHPYMNWDAGLNLIKKELGLLALATTTTLTLGNQPMSSGSYVLTSAVTSQPGPTYVSGAHVYEYLPAGTTTWRQFHSAPVVSGKSSFVWNYGGPQPIRVRFVPKDATVSQASTSSQIAPQVVSIATLQQQIADLTKKDADLAAQVASLQAQLAALQNPPKPVPAYGVDVSGWQTLDQVRALVADTTNQFVLIKASEGATFKASTFADQVAIAGTAFVGPYHYTGTPGNAAADEVAWFLAAAGDTAKTHRSFLDIETAVSADFIIAWLDGVKAATGIAPGWYTNWRWLNGSLGNGQYDPSGGIRGMCTVAQWEHLCDNYGLWFAEVAMPGQWTSISPKPGSIKTPTVIVHQYAYTPDTTGGQIDRDWTPDLMKLKV